MAGQRLRRRCRAVEIGDAGRRPCPASGSCRPTCSDLDRQGGRREASRQRLGDLTAKSRACSGWGCAGTVNVVALSVVRPPVTERTLPCTTGRVEVVRDGPRHRVARPERRGAGSAPGHCVVVGERRGRERDQTDEGENRRQRAEEASASRVDQRPARDALPRGAQAQPIRTHAGGFPSFARQTGPA